MQWILGISSQQEADRKCTVVTRYDALMFGLKKSKGSLLKQSTSDHIVPYA